jgi:hypothetical protein
MTRERKFNIAVLLALAVQAATVFMWAGASSQKLEVLEEEMSRQRSVGERLARIEAQLSFIDAHLDRIEEKLDAQ